MAVEVRKIIMLKEGKFDAKLVCPFCQSGYDVTIDPEDQTATFELAPDETFCEHFDPDDCEWEDDQVVFYFRRD
jgi:hypothetical protein